MKGTTVLRTRKQTIKSDTRRRRLPLGVLFIGAVSIAIAWSARAYLMTASPRSTRPAPNAVLAVRVAKLQAEADSLERRLAAAPRDIPMRQALLVIYQQMGRIDEATDQLAEIVRLRPDDEMA